MSGHNDEDLDVIRRYVPQIVIHRYIRRPEPIREPEIESFEAALGFFDISGFSTLGNRLHVLEKSRMSGEKLTETLEYIPSGNVSLHNFTGKKDEKLRRSTNSTNTAGLSSQRPEGGAADQLTKKLKSALEPVIDVIDRYHGDIIKFAGDAMVVLWETEITAGKKTNLGLLSFVAMQCSLDAIYANLDVVQSRREDSLGLHIGLGASAVTGNHIGGVRNRWEYYISGDACRQMNEAESRASAGQVVVSPECYASVVSCSSCAKLDIKSSKLTTGYYRLKAVEANAPSCGFLRPRATPDLFEFLRSYVPGSITSAVVSGDTVGEGMMRKITVCFMKLNNILNVHDHKIQVRKTHRAFATIQEVVYEVFGTIRQFILDDKGAVAIAVVGLPPFFFEENALRGIKIALRLGEKGVSAAIGVTTGVVFCGSVGSNVRSEYAVVGDSINLAARFMALARPGEILCDLTTKESIGDRFKTSKGSVVTVKGSSVPVQMYRVLPSSGKAAGRTINEDLDPVGVADIERKFSSIETNAIENRKLGFGSSRVESSIVCIEGESGAGKTTVIQMAQRMKCRTMTGIVDPVDRHTPYYALRSILHKLVSIENDRTVRRSSRRLVSVKDIKDDEFLKEEGELLEPEGTNSAGRRTTKVKFRRIVNAVRMAAIWHRENANDEPARADRVNSCGSLSSLPEPTTMTYGRKSELLHLLVDQKTIEVDMIPLLNMIAPIDIPETAFTLNLPDARRAKELKHLMCEMVRMFCSLSTIPAVWIFDDAQYIDSHSWPVLFDILASDDNSINAVFAYRKNIGAIPSAFLAIQNLRYADKFELKGLSPRDVSILLGKKFGIAIVQNDLHQFLMEKTKGNPADLIKLVNHMILSGTIVIDVEKGTTSILKPLSQVNLQIPEHLRAKVVARFDTIPAFFQNVLHIISSCVEECSLSMIQYVIQRFEAGGRRVSSVNNDHRDAIIESFKTLSAAELILYTPKNDSAVFPDESSRLVIYGGMLASHRKLIHESVLQWYAKFYPDEMKGCSEYNTTLGYHLLALGLYEDSLEHYELGAVQAILSGAIEEGLQCLLHVNGVLNEMSQAQVIDAKSHMMRSINLDFFYAQICILQEDWTGAVDHLQSLLQRRRGLDLKSISASRGGGWILRNRVLSAEEALGLQVVSKIKEAGRLLSQIQKSEAAKKRRNISLRRTSQLSICSHNRMARLHDPNLTRSTLQKMRSFTSGNRRSTLLNYSIEQAMLGLHHQLK